MTDTTNTPSTAPETAPADAPQAPPEAAPSAPAAPDASGEAKPADAPADTAEKAPEKAPEPEPAKPAPTNHGSARTAAAAPTPAPKPAPVGANPALIEWPTDPWGMTSDLRKAGIQAAGAVRGDEVKLKLLMDTLRIIAQHTQARVEGDRAEIKATIEARAARDAAVFQNNSRVVTSGVNKDAL